MALYNFYDIAIIGSGPAAYTAGIYAGRADFKTIIFEGNMPGGQLMTTTYIENFPGFKSIEGYQLMENMKEQSVENGCKCISETIYSLTKNDKYFELITDKDNIYLAKSVILAMGASANKMEFIGSDTFWNKGISACAVCDGALPIFRKKTVVVIGGGDSAMEEATFLARFASKVIILVRSNKLRASKVMVNKVLSNEKIEIKYNHNIKEASGDKYLKKIIVSNTENNENYEIECSGLFYAIGHTPNTDLVKNLVELKDNKYIKRQDLSTKTNIDGLFAAGDIMDDTYKQAITAAGTGCMASLDAIHYLENLY
jgi:thioredoxin reductase (NADPH)